MSSSSVSTTYLATYSHRDEHRELLLQNRYAAAIVFNILDRLVAIDSVLDLGCGIGVWMEAARVKPGRVVLGLDLEEFAPEDLVTPSETIVNIAIDRQIDLQRHFDLAICLETAEHIEVRSAPDLVSNCVRHSDIILFSAAIPGQGGLHHVNEQPPEYWQDLFGQAGYEVVDIIRPLIWHDARIPVWYRQNMLLFVNRNSNTTLGLLRAEARKGSVPLHRPHPDLFHWQAVELARCKAELADAKLRSEELQADLETQREYSGRALSKAWRLIQKLQSEREPEQAEQLAAAHRALALAEREKFNLRREFQNSVSWRLTEPVRAVGELLLRLRRQKRR
jgi:SAM-dependent methyltransferase